MRILTTATGDELTERNIITLMQKVARLIISCSANVSWSFKIKHHMMAIRTEALSHDMHVNCNLKNMNLFSITWMFERSRRNMPSDEAWWISDLTWSLTQENHVKIVLWTSSSSSFFSWLIFLLHLHVSFHMRMMEHPAQAQECAHRPHDRQAPVRWWMQSRCSDQFMPKNC